MDNKNIFRKLLQDSIDAKQAFLQNNARLESCTVAAILIIDRYKKGGRLYACGNGGSAADAQHMVAELVSRLGFDRPALPAIALTVDSSILTAVGNDYGYDKVFSRQVEANMVPDDILFAITTSGNSANIIEALKACQSKGATSILLTGHDGGSAKEFCDHIIIADGKATCTIQELHLVIEHAICAYVENEFFGDRKD